MHTRLEWARASMTFSCPSCRFLVQSFWSLMPLSIHFWVAPQCFTASLTRPSFTKFCRWKSGAQLPVVEQLFVLVY